MKAWCETELELRKQGVDPASLICEEKSIGLTTIFKGGAGSGNFGHAGGAGGPGNPGGSQTESSEKVDNNLIEPTVGRASSVKLSSTEVLDTENLLKKFKEVGGATENLETGGKLHGFYDPNTKTIYLNSELKDVEYKGIKFGENTVDCSLQGRFNHEYGHHIWNHTLSNKEKRDWEQTYNKVKPDYWRAQVSWKASQGASEAFSELYAVHVRGVSAETKLNAYKQAWKMFDSMMKT